MQKRMVFCAVCAGLVSGWALGPRAALADEASSSSLDLEWDVAEGCPDRETARAAIENFVGKHAEGDRPQAMVSVKITRLPDGGWEARIVSRGPEVAGERELRGPSCERLVEATALIVAIALDPLSTAERVSVREPAPLEPIDAEPAKAVKPAPPTERAVAPAAEARAEQLRLATGILAAGDLGSLPSPTMGVGLALALANGPWFVEIEAKVWIPQLALRGPVPGSGGEIGLYSGGLRGCIDAVRVFGRELRLGPCLAAEAGLSTGAGIHLTHPVRSSGLWAAAVAGLLARQSTPVVTLWMLAEAGLPIARPTYEIEDFEPPVFQASPVFGRLSLGVAWFFLY